MIRKFKISDLKFLILSCSFILFILSFTFTPLEILQRDTPFLTGFTCYAQKEVKDREKEYIIYPNDILEITVYGEPDLSTTVRVSPDGTISYPLLGNIKVAGLTVLQLEKKLTDLLGEDYLVIPQVSVFVKEYARISILGQVRSPGSYQMKENLTFTQALSLAGGFTDVADTSRVKIIRTIDSKKETIEVNVDQILDKAATDVEIKANDTIIVEEYGRISIIGQVARPGVYNLKKGLTVLEAIGLAGGFTSTAAQDGTRIIRVEKGKRNMIRVHISDIIKGTDKSKDILLQAGDTIVVPESFF